LEAVNKIDDYMSELSAEEAFKIADRDFDGYINLVDMKEFLSRVVQLGDEESLSDLRLNRLIKLLDKFKRGFIQRGDFCSFLLNDSHREHEWMQNAK
jgi:Ca2+-binding EF-hand superfamily protein